MHPQADARARINEEARRRAIALVSETMGDLVAFWGFKASMGRIWALLYLSIEPLTADVIAEETKLSAGAVSMAITELMQWGLVSRDPLIVERKRHYQAETDIWAIIRRIIRERELRLVAQAIERFSEAVDLLETVDQRDPGRADIAFMLKRLRGLLDLARIGYKLVEKLAEFGQFSLLPIRGTLGGEGRT
jgi:DNA-binding transcriptional regulator GbsR (MarR family)